MKRKRFSVEQIVPNSPSDDQYHSCRCFAQREVPGLQRTPWMSALLGRSSGEGDLVAKEEQASLEKLVEAGDLKLEILHPGGLAIARELADFCHIGSRTRVLDVASGTGESACYLTETFGCPAIGIDSSAVMIRRSQAKAREKKLSHCALLSG